MSFASPGGSTGCIPKPAGSGQHWAMHGKPGPFEHVLHERTYVGVGRKITHGKQLACPIRLVEQGLIRLEATQAASGKEATQDGMNEAHLVVRIRITRPVEANLPSKPGVGEGKFLARFLSFFF